jgi:hypothetical protein
MWLLRNPLGFPLRLYDLKKFSEPFFPGHVLPATQFDGFGLID